MPSWRDDPIAGEAGRRPWEQDTVVRIPQGAPLPPQEANPGAFPAFMRGLAQGVTFDWADEAMAGVKTGAGLWGDYGAEVENQRRGLREAQQAHPFAYGAGQVAGMGATLVAPGGAVARGATAAGRALRAGGIGLGAGAVQGAGAGETAADKAEGALWGAGMGGVAGVAALPAARAVGAGVRTFRNLFGRGDAPAVLRDVDMNRVRGELTRNPGLSAADVDEGAQRVLQGVVLEPGRARQIAVDAIGQQSARMPGMIRGAMDQAGGQTADTVMLEARLMQTARQNAAQGFGQALRSAGPVDANPVLRAIDTARPPPGGAMDRWLTYFRRRLVDDQGLPIYGADQLHVVQTNMREVAEALSNSANAEERLAGQMIRNMRQGLVDQIDQAAAGLYRPAQRQFADDMAVRDAFRRGLDVFRNRTGEAGLEDRPEAWRALVQGLSVEEQQALREGVRVALDREMGAVRNAARSGAEVPQVEFNRQKLEAILGPMETAQLMQTLQDAQAVARKANRVIGNSETASRQAARESVRVPETDRWTMGDLALPGIGYMTTGSGWGAAAGALASGVGKVAKAVGRAGAIGRNEMLARALTAEGPEGIRRLSAAQQAARNNAAIQAMVRALMISGATTQGAPAAREFITGR